MRLRTTRLAILTGHSSGRAGVLDMLNGPPSLAYSLRRLRAGYNGPCGGVQLTGDGTPKEDIYFGPDDRIDVAALLTFSGSGSAYFIHWHDQSGRGVTPSGLSRDLLAETDNPDSRPKIVNNGTFLGEIDFFASPVGATGRLLTTSRFYVPAFPFTTNAVFRKIRASQAMIWGAASGNYQMLRIDGLPSSRVVAGVAYGDSFDATDGAIVTQVTLSETSAMAWVNGVFVGSTDAATAQGLITDGVGVWNGRLSNFALRETMLFPRALTEGERQTLERNQGAAWGINVS